jgi:probable rRNA maturation factor
VIELDLQVAVRPAGAWVPDQGQVACWVEAALGPAREAAQLTVRVVEREEMTALNETYRRKSGPTNVLSFPFEAPPGVELPLLGDIVICAAVVAEEAAAQGKAPEAHWAHMVVHGTLHLLGHDHIEPSEAEAMESLERRTLAGLGYSDPYEEEARDRIQDAGRG